MSEGAGDLAKRTLSDWVAVYSNTVECNDRVHAQFTALTDTVALIRRHRSFVEEESWGFGDRAFHYMWWLLLRDIHATFPSPLLCEIGVYKGQVISLWQLIAQELAAEISIVAISPFQGNMKPLSRVGRFLRRTLDPQFRADLMAGNLYAESDYLADVRKIFGKFDLSESRVRFVRGYSHQPEIIAAVRAQYSLIYIDGDHGFDAVARDIANFAPLVAPGGYLVMDDASCLIPGTTFAKGIEGVARACEVIPSRGFINVLNVGHNRVYKRVN